VWGALFGLLAGIALVIASVGLYALTAQSVVQRTQEIGIRIALGAQVAQVVWLFAWRTVAPLVLGVLTGLGGALAAGSLLQTLLVGTSARDPLTLAVVTGLLVLVALIGTVLPARRAARIDPTVALRYE
jgi:ABC-type antimicrobial peptide transport system permease subunit